MNAKMRARRFGTLKTMRCLACVKHGSLLQCGPTEIHHLNAFGHAGMARRGDEFTIPLGSFHHRGVPLQGWTVSRMTEVFGPALSRNSRAFRETYGTDDELLAETNRKLGLEVAA